MQRVVLFMCLSLFAIFTMALEGEAPTNLNLHAPNPTEIELKPCQRPGTELWGLCGEYEVYENRKTMQGRTIPIQMVIYPATGQNAVTDPLFYFVGGPGQGAAEFGGFILSSMAEMNKTRDIVFIDQRGTGGSNGLKCMPSGDPTLMSTWLAEMYPVDDVKACRKELEKNADLAHYLTSIAMDDIHEVRAALGYDKINISGGSYGTRACMSYMRQHPETVRTVFLGGLAPTFMAMPSTFAEDTERALKAVIADCKADPDCNKAFPNFGKNVAKVRKQIEKEPFLTEIKHPQTGKMEKISFGLGPFLANTRAMLYSTNRAKELPLLFEQMANGDFTRMIVYTAFYAQNISQAIAEGMYLSVTCSEDDPFYDYKKADKAAKGTFLGDYRIFQQRRACDHWVRTDLVDGYRDPVKSNIPTLLMSGQWDPVTPPAWGEKAGKYMTNKRHIVVPNASHNLGGIEEHGGAKIIQQFVDQASFDGIDFSPLQQVKRPAFVLKDEDAYPIYQ